MNSEAEYEHAYMEAWRKLPAEGASSLNRMRDAARQEASRIESAQCGRIMSGDMHAPMPGQMQKRDDFVAIVRLIDNIIASPEIQSLLPRRGAEKK